MKTAEKIKENRYLRYFLGFESYNNQAPENASILVHVRERIGGDEY